MFYDNTLPDLTPQERRELFVAMTMTLTRLHSTDWRGCGLEQYGAKGDYSTRQVYIQKHKYFNNMYTSYTGVSVEQ